jgi:hypothetical protein
VIDSAQPTLNTATATKSIVSNAATAADLNAYMGAFVEVRASCAFRTRAKSTATAACTAGDMPRSADTSYHWFVTPATRYISVRGNSAAGTLYYSRASQ